MRIWQNIIISIILHVVIIATTFIISSRDTTYSVPAGYMKVSLIEEVSAVQKGNVGVGKYKHEITFHDTLQKSQSPINNEASKSDPTKKPEENSNTTPSILLKSSKLGISEVITTDKAGGMNQTGTYRGHNTIEIQTEDKIVDLDKVGRISLEVIGGSPYVLIREKIEKAKVYPILARKQGIEGRVILRFRIRPDEEVDDIRIVKGSGSETLDRASIETIKKSAPLPYVNEWIEVTIVYRLDNS